jgi:hypothetical protein
LIEPIYAISGRTLCVQLFESPSERLYRLLGAPLIQAGKAHEQTMLGGIGEEVDGNWLEFKSVATSRGNHFAIIERHSEAAHDLHSGGIFCYRQPLREMLGSELDKVLLPLRIETPCAPQVTRKMTLGDEVSKSKLKRQW